MALVKPVIVTSGSGAGNGLELFVSTDIYRYDIDNRPLVNLAANDQANKDAIDLIVDEIEDAYTGKLWPGGSDNTFGALDSRLDNMDLFLRNFFEIRNVQFSSFMQSAMFLRERYTSGFLNGPFPSKFIRSNFSAENNEFMPAPFGGFYAPERAGTVKDGDHPDETMYCTIGIETRIEQDGDISWSATRKPLYALVNGFVVPMLNEHGGIGGLGATQGQDTPGRRAGGNNGPITINFTQAPTTGYRFDFVFLEVWLQEVSSTDSVFYPYGALDWSDWTRDTIAGPTDGVTDNFTFQPTTKRKIVPKDEVGWGFSVYVLDSPGEAITDFVSQRAAEDDGTGSIVGTNCNGTIDYDTGEIDITFDAGHEPANGKYVVGVYRSRAVNDPADERLRGTISFLPNGNYLQIQHQWRVVEDVDYESYPDFFSDPSVLARAENDADIATYTFENGLNTFHDGSLWFAGSGNSASKTALGTYDGYVYAMPVGAWSRFNTTSWSLTNQNGGVNRPDGLTHGIPDDKQWLDLRPTVLHERYDLTNAAENTLDRIIRGEHTTLFGQAMTDGNDDGTFTGQGIWGSQIPELWKVYQYSGLAVNENVNICRDIGLSISDDPSDGADYTAPVAHHDGIRRLFSPQEEVQQIPISITDVTNSTDANPSPLVTYNNSTKTITVTTNVSSLSGYDSGSGGAIVNDTYPRLWWRGTRQPVIYSTRWTGLGSKTATAVIDDTAATYEPNGAIDGYVEVLYPESTGVGRPLSIIDHSEFTDGVNTYTTQVAGNEDGSPANQANAKWLQEQSVGVGFNLPSGIAFSPDNLHVYVCDAANSRVVKLQFSDLSYAAQYPVYANYPFDLGSYSGSVHLKYPTAVATDAAGNVYVVDRDAHRIVKLNSDLDTVLGTFGTDSVATNDPASTTALNSPEGIAIDSSGNIYIADTALYRVVKLNSSFTYQGQIGDGTSNPANNQFVLPTGLAVGNVGGTDYLYVADASRLVSIKLSTFEVDAILGSSTQADMLNFFSNIATSFTAIDEDANGNKYVVLNEKKQVYKFDSGWSLLATFGDDKVAGYDTEHLYWPLDIAYDSDAGLVYIADGHQYSFDKSDQPPGRIVILDAADLSYVDSYEFGNSNDESCAGLHLYPSASTGGKLYVTARAKMWRLDLPVPGSRGTASNWTEDWEISTIDGDDCLALVDVVADASNSNVYVGDVMRAEIYKLNPANGAHVATYSIGIVWPPTTGAGAPFGLEISPDGSTLYAGDGTNNYIHQITTSTMVQADTLSDPKYWPTGEWPFSIRLNFAQDKLFVLLSNSVIEYEWPLTPSASKITDNFLKNIAETPFSDEVDTEVDWENIKDVAIGQDILYVVDGQSNTITSVDAKTLQVLGQIGSPAIVNMGRAGFSGPAGIATSGEWIIFSDTFSNRVMKGYRFFPNVERGTGRVTYLMAPPSSFTTTFQARYTPYQGQWNRVNTPAIYGRNFVSDNNRMYITTLGRGTPTTISQEGGLGFYANMIEHLPTPVGTPKKAPRVTDEYVFAPQKLPITSEVTGTPYLQLPVVNRYPATATQLFPLYGAGSRYDFNRLLFIQGPGPNNPVDTPGDWVGRGYEATGSFPGFDTLETFPLMTLSIPRLIFGTCIVELEGKAYLVIYSTYKAHAENKINDGSITADVFQIFGNPGIKPRY